MAIENRKLPAGTRLAAHYKGETYSAEVVETEGDIRYRLATGEEFTSPSAAGSHVMNGISCNGWRFWHLEAELPPARTSKSANGMKKQTGAKPKRNVLIRKVPNQKGLVEGSSRWWCSCCMASFLHHEEAQPRQCPEGHPREASEMEAR